jgi:hypothetical protein
MVSARERHGRTVGLLAAAIVVLLVLLIGLTMRLTNSPAAPGERVDPTDCSSSAC